jgi:hypothetical protein
MSPTTMFSMAGSEVAAEAGVTEGQEKEAGRDGEVDEIGHGKRGIHFHASTDLRKA